MEEAIDVYVRKHALFGEYLYRVWVDGKVYDKFFSKDSLTESEMYDVAQGYKDSINSKVN